ncbi:MAG: DUF2318 domain-containing protein [Desulfomonile tiedjei]|uniref:DUF2318 domain-containing protein n=1 Tax=Desulfomonile tiedjei TaxID=2358 RepID=A0A9D6VBT0_9BACT|nr:DUF2318 domain-containing protein [Desulfomonile tiedjei]
MKIHKHYRLIVGAITVAAIVSTFSIAFAWNFTVPAQEVKPVNGAFVFPVSAFADGKARHFEYKISPNERVRFFVVKSTDGIIRAALDACEVCHRAKKGYVQQGNDMICINCGLKFRTDKVNEVKGGCNPHPVNRTIQGENLVISQQEVASGLRYFQ